MSILLGTVELPGDLRWADEFNWLPTAQQIEVTTGGALLVEESAQLAGRPITLESGTDPNGAHWAVVSRATLEQLRALAQVPRTAAMTLVLQDGREFAVRFLHGDAAAVEGTPLQHIAPHVDADKYHLTLRLMQV